MKPWEKWSFTILTLVVTATGIVYFCMKYFMENNDPFSVINHPLQPYMLDLHLLAAPGLVFVMGIILNSHIARKLPKRNIPNRKSGWIALLSFPTMTLSGYLLPMFADPVWAKAMLVLHLGSGSLFAVTYAVHQVISIRLLRRNNAANKEARGLRQSLA